VAICVALDAGASRAVDFIDQSQPAAIDQPQINVILQNSPGGTPLQGKTYDDSLNLVPTINIQAYLDTGASGILLSVATTDPTSADSWHVPSSTFNGQAVQYNDVGVIGTAQIDVSQPIYMSFAGYSPAINAAVEVNTSFTSQIQAYYSQTVGQVRTQIGPTTVANDSASGIDNSLLGDLNVVGMPAMAGKTVVIDARSSNTVMRTLSGTGDLTSLFDGDNLNNLSLRTYLYNPGTPFNASTIDSDPGIPSTNMHVKLSYADFSGFTSVTPTGAPGPTLTHNPFIGPDPTRALAANPASLPPDNTPKIKVGFGGNYAEGSFLLDTGAGASFISDNIAAQLHVRYTAGTEGKDNAHLEIFNPVTGATIGAVPNQFQLAVGGIGGSGTVAGFFLDSLLIRTLEGNAAYDNDPRHLNFLGAPVLVTNITVTNPTTQKSLTLDGDLGMNFLAGSLSLDMTNFTVANFTPGVFDWLTYDEPSGVLGLQLNSAFHLKGDFNGDGKVTNADIQTMLDALANLSAYKTGHSLTDSDLLTIADMNGDGVVNASDIQPFMNLLAGAPLPTSLQGVPEPASAVLLAMGTLALLFRRTCSGAGLPRAEAPGRARPLHG
jgi:hypothetical protein